MGWSLRRVAAGARHGAVQMNESALDTSVVIRKIFQGAANRQEMFACFNRHSQRPQRAANDGALFAGEWLEIQPALYDYMLDMLPPYFMRNGMFAMMEFLTDSVTSVFFEININGTKRCYHGYCDLSDRWSPDRMRAVIIERESGSITAMTRDEKLEHIWSSTHENYRGYAGPDWAVQYRGRRTILTRATIVKLLDQLSDDEIAAKLRHLPQAIAA
jgi:hypothetical protein